MTLATRKPIATLDAAGDGCPTLRRALGPLNLTTLGIGSVIGTGIFVTALLRRAAAAPGGEPSPEPRSGSGESWSIPRPGRSRATAGAESVLSRTLDTHIGELRRKLEDDPSVPRHILTVRKPGYRLARDH